MFFVTFFLIHRLGKFSKTFLMQLKLLNTKGCTLFNFLQHHGPRMKWKHKGSKVLNPCMCQLTGIKSSRRSLQHFERERGHDIGLPGDDAGPFDGLCADGGDQLSPVDHCQTLLGTELDWGQVVTLQNLVETISNIFQKRWKSSKPTWVGVKRSNFRRSKQKIETITLQNWSGDRTIVDFLSFLQNWSGDRKGHSGPRFFLF